jgi:hypothetical protein
MRIKFATRVMFSAEGLPISLVFTKFPVNGAYNKPLATLSNNSAISSREFDLGEPAR